LLKKPKISKKRNNRSKNPPNLKNQRFVIRNLLKSKELKLHRSLMKSLRACQSWRKLKVNQINLRSQKKSWRKWQLQFKKCRVINRSGKKLHKRNWLRNQHLKSRFQRQKRIWLLWRNLNLRSSLLREKLLQMSQSSNLKLHLKHQKFL